MFNNIIHTQVLVMLFYTSKNQSGSRELTFITRKRLYSCPSPTKCLLIHPNKKKMKPHTKHSTLQTYLGVLSFDTVILSTTKNTHGN